MAAQKVKSLEKINRKKVNEITIKQTHHCINFFFIISATLFYIADISLHLKKPKKISFNIKFILFFGPAESIKLQ
jgi:hypothetical protein